MAKGLVLFFNTTVLHYSTTPGPMLSGHCGNFKSTFLWVIVPILLAVAPVKQSVHIFL